MSDIRYKIVTIEESRNIDVIKNARGYVVESKPDNDSYKGKLILEGDDGTILEFKLAYDEGSRLKE